MAHLCTYSAGLDGRLSYVKVIQGQQLAEQTGASFQSGEAWACEKYRSLYETNKKLWENHTKAVIAAANVEECIAIATLRTEAVSWRQQQENVTQGLFAKLRKECNHTQLLQEENSTQRATLASLTSRHKAEIRRSEKTFCQEASSAFNLREQHIERNSFSATCEKQTRQNTTSQLCLLALSPKTIGFDSK